MRDLRTSRQRRAMAGFRAGAGCHLCCGPLRAFTLIELLVVVAILLVLMSIMTTSLARVRAAGKSFVCKNQLKNIAFDFVLFADDYAHPWRGDSDKDGRPGFYIEDFQEREYGIAEFWPVESQGQSSQGEAVKLKASEHPMVCPAGPQELEKRPGLSCRQRAVVPEAHVSLCLNMRLDRASVRPAPGAPPELIRVRLSKQVTAYPMVPLAFDVDAGEASGGHVSHVPYFSAPPSNSWDNYSSGAFWFPSLRHGGRCNAAFIGGHVLSSLHPEREPGWDWKYQPPVN